jgi:ABC-type sugar transport system permease subunit
MVIFSAALRGVPQETVEAAIIDGANPRQLFFRVKLPQIFSTVVVVWTYLVTDVLKVFDIPYALSANDDDKLLLATMMEAAMNTWSIGGNNVDNLFAAIAIMLMLTVIPHMVFPWMANTPRTKTIGTLRIQSIMYSQVVCPYHTRNNSSNLGSTIHCPYNLLRLDPEVGI